MAEFDYFYGQEADLFSFIRVPKLLFTDARFKELTSDAKILYGLLLDRMSLSAENKWFDERGRVYIIYTIEQISDSIGCSNGKACRTLKQLVDIGLVDKNFKGQGKAALLYVKKILSDMSQRENKDVQNGNPGMSKTEIQGFSKRESNNTEINNTDFSNTENKNISSNLIRIYPPEHKPFSDDAMRRDEKRDSCMSDISKLKRKVYESIDVDSLKRRFPYNGELIDQIANLIVDVLSDDARYFVVGGAKKSPELVKEQFRSLDYSHVAYVIDSLKSNTTDVKNVRQYLIAALYNAPLTIDAHYENMVSHDHARGYF
ncbi:DUF6017 domain-containing protein [Butyrivibrio sp. INlla16]|uniref:DUF6017 domain-containing protein n=1 Tax=Butyrivibrio sp. INlla16 TaxID=1520807 RepID=UPI000891E51C|nr:DUF6017 domain-containing protein [Butyrivibrio sp. INlla16]SDB04571.1 Replication initiator protein A (RepA) N-terminus [Butyrivibrio sp. INlla16]